MFRYGIARALVLVSLALAAPTASAQPFSVGGDPRVDPTDFEITTFASGLDFPLSMQELEDGSILVGVARPDGSGQNFFSSIGELVRLVDADEDGVADGPGTVLYTGLPGAITSVRVIDDLAVVASGVIGSWNLYLLRRGAGPGDAYTLLGSVDFAIPLPWSHLTFGAAVRPDPGQPGHVDVFFGMGSKEDAVATVVPVPYSGLVSGSVAADTLYRLDVDDSGATPVVSAPVLLATGVRNGFGLALEAATGDLYFAENGYKDPNDPATVLMADELNRIAAADIGGAVEDFGFPGNYIDYTTGNEVGSGAVDPEVAFLTVPFPGGGESLGPSEIAFAPPGFPPGLDDGVFVSFHGEFSAAGLANTKNPLVYVDLGTGDHFHFIGVDEAGLGHLDGLLATDDALFVSDFTNAAGLSAFGTGAIYRIRALPSATDVPALGAGALALSAALLSAAGLRRRAARRRRG